VAQEVQEVQALDHHEEVVRNILSFFLLLDCIFFFFHFDHDWDLRSISGTGEYLVILTY